MSLDPLFRRMSMMVAMFAFIGVVLGGIALLTNYWTMENVSSPGMPIPTANGTVVINEKFDWTWNGLFYMCTSRANVACMRRFWTTTFVLCLLGLMCLLVGGIFSIWEMFKTSDRRFAIPMLHFVACVLMTAGLFDYGSMARLNSHSSRSMISAIVFAYAALPISAFIAGRYSAYDRYVNNGHVHNGQKYVPASTNGN
ncbi:unnamed protein product [Rotaria sordida]|uniref:Uncharacterized protein n=1 Tax=Rotaria sordida TaxID=392033 RepID=A0A813V3L7_9BILA|nr:unnamed protein product [Rotaria sordida]CAF0788596.1 unnamed protein product [Rotaria sordida]CAF0805815.1 unnamed protein product [Rotaria sordida]CAF0811412.1 unnamed protein product [Rotaria sordida]CAF0818403.1 unnamed protein product [Rotaria sordida]